MELLKTYIQTPEFKRSASIQVTLDNDFNVTDSKPDIERIIQEKAKLNIREMKTMQDKCRIRGVLQFSVLYTGDDGSGQLQHLDGEIPFEEMINIDGLQAGDEARIHWDMEDLRAGVIHSRKMNIRSIIVLHLQVMRLSNEEVVTDIVQEPEVWTQSSTVCLNQCKLRGKDQLHLHEEITIPSNRPNILEILWHQEMLENLETKLQDGYIRIYGRLAVFVLYRDEMMENTWNDIEFEVPIEGRIELTQAAQEMILDAKLSLEQIQLDIHSDHDGESRIISVEGTICAEYSLYKEEHIQLLKDIYSSKISYIPEIKTVNVEHLMLKNRSQCPIRERVRLNPDTARMLQICHTRANVKIDQLEKKDEGILIEGVIYLGILYISSDDHKPVNSTNAVVPFAYTIEVGAMKPSDVYEVYPSIEQISATMTDNDEVEVKMIITLDAMVFENIPMEVMCQIREEALDYEKIEALPGMVGHVAVPEDTLWGLAKRYYANPKDIQEVNDLKDETLPVGQSILIMKNMEIFK